MKPQRIQLSRKKGWRMPPNTVNVARPSKWGNPHPIGFCPTCGVEHDRAEAVADFLIMLKAGKTPPFSLADMRVELRGRNLACWCKPNEICHADVLLAIANSP